MTSQMAMIEPADEDLQPDTRMCGSTGENASAAGHSSAPSLLNRDSLTDMTIVWTWLGTRR